MLLILPLLLRFQWLLQQLAAAVLVLAALLPTATVVVAPVLVAVAPAAAVNLSSGDRWSDEYVGHWANVSVCNV